MAEKVYQGRVLWFNKRRGYGFVSLINIEDDDELKGKELFCHYTNINTIQYKTLFPGEYISFNVEKNLDGRYICINIRGIGGGPLLIENSTHMYKVYPKKNMDEVDRDSNMDVN